MNRFWKLVHYELYRFRKIYFALFAITAIVQFIAIYLYAQNYLARLQDILKWQSITEAEFIAQYGPTSFYNMLQHNVTYFAPILLCIVTLLLYMFMIWYRDWLGKNMFIYRLLMLPTARKSLYFAKASAIMLMVWGLIAFQMLLFPLQKMFYIALIPDHLHENLPINFAIYHHEILSILIPRTFMEFILYYAAGLMSVLVIFTAILLERSYRLKGAIGGIVYIAAMAVLFFLPLVLFEFLSPGYLYAGERIVVLIISGVLITFISLALSIFLLNKKVTV